MASTCDVEQSYTQTQPPDLDHAARGAKGHCSKRAVMQLPTAVGRANEATSSWLSWPARSSAASMTPTFWVTSAACLLLWYGLSL